MNFHVCSKTAKLLQTIRLTILNVVLDTRKARNMDMESTSNHCQKKASKKYGKAVFDRITKRSFRQFGLFMISKHV